MCCPDTCTLLAGVGGQLNGNLRPIFTALAVRVASDWVSEVDPGLFIVACGISECNVSTRFDSIQSFTETAHQLFACIEQVLFCGIGTSRDMPWYLVRALVQQWGDAYGRVQKGVYRLISREVEVRFVGETGFTSLCIACPHVGKLDWGTI